MNSRAYGGYNSYPSGADLYEQYRRQMGAMQPAAPSLANARAMQMRNENAARNAVTPQPLRKVGQTPIAAPTPPVAPTVLNPATPQLRPTAPVPTRSPYANVSPEEEARLRSQASPQSTQTQAAPTPTQPAPAPMQKAVARPTNTTLTGTQRQSAYERALSRTT